MNTIELITASECDFNVLWKCVHSKVPYGTKCVGPCEKATVFGEPLIKKEDEKKV